MWGDVALLVPFRFLFSILTIRLTIHLFPDSGPRKTQTLLSTGEKGSIES